MGLISNIITGGIAGGFEGAASGALDSFGQKRSKLGAKINPNRPSQDPTDFNLSSIIRRRRTQATPDYTGGMGAPNTTPDYDPTYQD